MTEVNVYDSNSIPFKEVKGIEGKYKRVIESDKGLIVGMGKIQPGQSMGWHAHPEEEAFVVLSGEGIAYWKENGIEKQAKLSKDKVFYKGPNVEHNMKATGEKALIGVVCKL
jgi:quercetin dioxygenase-like cupin family protein